MSDQPWYKDALAVTGRTLEIAEAASGAIPGVGSIMGAVAKVASVGVKMIQGMEENQAGSKALQGHISEIVAILKPYSEGNTDSANKPNFEKLLKEILSVGAQVQTLQQESMARQLVAHTDNTTTTGTLNSLKEAVDNAIQRLQLRIGVDTQQTVQEVNSRTRNAAHQQLVDRLGSAGNGVDEKTTQCLKDTRVMVLKRINDWVANQNVPERVMWIRGMAGRGKSIIATTVYQRRGVPLAPYSIFAGAKSNSIVARYTAWQSNWQMTDQPKSPRRFWRRSRTTKRFPRNRLRSNSDNTIRIWDVAAGTQVGKPLSKLDGAVGLALLSVGDVRSIRRSWDTGYWSTATF